MRKELIQEHEKRGKILIHHYEFYGWLQQELERYQ
jgi:hypothetical protein